MLEHHRAQDDRQFITSSHYLHMATMMVMIKQFSRRNLTPSGLVSIPGSQPAYTGKRRARTSQSVGATSSRCSYWLRRASPLLTNKHQPRSQQETRPEVVGESQLSFEKRCSIIIIIRLEEVGFPHFLFHSPCSCTCLTWLAHVETNFLQSCWKGFW